ncbi:hypothetical protein [Borreliella turdi]|uniref:hypothetical protein n=1 Tax=Borreliella turdi TaxID=57863 RepID=UPI0012486C46|nr:hypothetical protein [Borreliella turdi]
MGKKVILILLGILILSCSLFTHEKEKTIKQQIIEDIAKKTIKQQIVEDIAKKTPISEVSIQKVEIRQSNQNPTSIEDYYKQNYPIQTFTINFSINRENEFQQEEDKILSTKGEVESLSILINKKLLDSKNLVPPTFKKLKEIKNIENLFQNQELFFVLNLKNKNNNNVINIMLNPPNDIFKPKDYVLLGIKDIIKKGISQEYLNPIYRFQIKNKKDYHSIDYNKVSITEKSIELDLLPHNQIFKMNKNFIKLLEIITNINGLKSIIQKEYI